MNEPIREWHAGIREVYDSEATSEFVQSKRRFDAKEIKDAVRIVIDKTPE